jgi:hypothetical protein
MVSCGAPVRSSFKQLLQHLFQVSRSEFWGGHLVILNVLCVVWNDFLYDSCPQGFPQLRIRDFLQLLGSVGLVELGLKLEKRGVVFSE